MAPTKTIGSLTFAVAFLAAGIALFSSKSPLVSFSDVNDTANQAPRIVVDETNVPSRSGSYPTNLIRDSTMNEIGQRSIDNTVKVWFTLHANGDGLSQGTRIESSDFKDIDAVISKHCCGLMSMDASRCESNSGARLVSDTGVRMLSFNDVEDGQRVYCVPQGVHFVWPMKKTGNTFYPKNVVGPIPGKPIRMRQLSENPRVFAVDNFVSPEEVEEILRSNRNRMTPSEVGFGGWQDDTRTSSTSWDFTSKAAKTIQSRTFQILGMDVQPELADALQVLRYTPHGANGYGQWYKPHVDWFNGDGYDGHDPKVDNGTNRFATMFLYLSDVYNGGATVFPLSTTHEGYNGEKLVHDGTVNVPGYINTAEARYCCNESSTALRSQPRQGNAVLFYSQGPDGTLDPYSLHGGCPPLSEDKWSANVWIWNRLRPDKSKAKDLPKGKAKSDPASRTVTFRNPKNSVPVDIYWDSNAPVEGFENLDEFSRVFAEDEKEGFPRFKHQGSIEPGRDLMVNSYDTHVFISVEKGTQRVLFAGPVKKPEDLQAHEKEIDGQLFMVGRS